MVRSQVNRYWRIYHTKKYLKFDYKLCILKLIKKSHWKKKKTVNEGAKHSVLVVCKMYTIQEVLPGALPGFSTKIIRDGPSRSFQGRIQGMGPGVRTPL